VSYNALRFRFSFSHINGSYRHADRMPAITFDFSTTRSAREISRKKQSSRYFLALSLFKLEDPRRNSTCDIVTSIPVAFVFLFAFCSIANEFQSARSPGSVSKRGHSVNYAIRDNANILQGSLSQTRDVNVRGILKEILNLGNLFQSGCTRRVKHYRDSRQTFIDLYRLESFSSSLFAENGIKCVTSPSAFLRLSSLP